MISYNKLLGKKKVDGNFGLELEVEYTEPTIFEHKPKDWRVKKDSSLRNYGVEFVSSSAFNKEEVSEKIKEICKYATQFKSYIPNCSRTSFHVHYNIGSLEPIKIMNCIISYWIVEDLITKYCNKSRIGNQYCLSSSISSEIFSDLKKSIEKDKVPFLSFNNNDSIRYMGQNLCSIYKFTSLENRCMDGDASRPDRFINWVNNLDSIYCKAVSYSSPKEVCNYAFDNPYNFYNSFVTKDFISFYDKKIIDEKLLECSEFIYDTDWDSWNKSFIQPKNNIGVIKNIFNGRHIFYDVDLNYYIYTYIEDNNLIGTKVSYEDYATVIFGNVENYLYETGITLERYNNGEY